MLALHAINLPIFHPPAAPQVTVISTSPSKKDEALNRLGADKFVVRCAWLGGGCCCARWAVCGELHAAEMWELNVLGGRRLSRAAALLPSSYCGGMFVPPISYWSHQPQHCSRNKEEMEAAAGTLDGIVDTVSAKHDLVTYLSLLKTNGAFWMGLCWVVYGLDQAAKHDLVTCLSLLKTNGGLGPMAAWHAPCTLQVVWAGVSVRLRAALLTLPQHTCTHAHTPPMLSRSFQCLPLLVVPLQASL